ncbi:MAG: HAMP domain-containing sensor histidine kinase [Synechocystis sp.]|nr:HAMP domain-containing sensor histidine kinase [Synechocystis sp.]
MIAHKFQQIKSKLMLSYLVVMIAILISTSFIVYKVIARNLYRQFENSALKSAKKAGLILDLIQHEHREYFSPDDVNLTLKDLIDHSEGSINEQNNGMDIYTKNPYFFSDEDLSVQWLDEKGQVLVKEGDLALPIKDFSDNTITKYYDNRKGLFSLILPIRNNQNSQTVGYIKIIESTHSLTTNLIWLQISLITGGIFALILTVGGAFLLTRQSLQPIIESFQELKQFTADASHELRTPLTVIKTSAELALNNDPKISSETLHKIKIIASATEEMNVLVNDLLLLSRMDKEITEKEKIFIKLPLDEICEDLIELLEGEAETHQITLLSDVTANIWIRGNAAHLQRLFTNVLGNALQYTPKGGTVTLTLTKELKWAIVTVQDTGIGINSQELTNIFKRLWRGEGGRLNRKEGSGLGLAIAEKIAIHHGGKITVNSILSQGSTFKIYLPIAS